MARHRRITALLIAIGLGALIVAGCKSPTDSGNDPNTSARTWTVQLDQDAGGTPGRIWFIVNVTLRDDPARGSCTGSTITTVTGTFTAPPSRIQTSNLTGDATGYWTKGSGSCDAFSLTLSPPTSGDFVVTGTHAAASISTVSSGFGAIDPSAIVAGTWSTGGTVRGKAYVYPKQLGYLPDSHFDLQMLVSETGCTGCELPHGPAAEFCIFDGPQPIPTCVGGWDQEHLWVKDTTINTVLPRNARQVDDRWYFSLIEVNDGGGPNFQIGCDRAPTGPDQVQIEVVSGVYSPVLNCRPGWVATGLLNKTAGDQQTTMAGTRVPTDLQIQLLAGTGSPQALAPIAWTITGGGTLNDSSTFTDATGQSTVQWTLGSLVGRQTVTATANLPGTGTTSVTFEATASATGPHLACGVPGGPGTDHPGGQIVTNETWDATGNPHRVNNTIYLGATLTVNAGAVVCMNGSMGVAIISQAGGHVMALGTAAAPILFTALDSTIPWGSFQLAGSVTDTNVFVHTRIEFGLDGIVASVPVILDSSVIRQVTYLGLSLSGGADGSRILRSRFDTTLTSGGPPMVTINASNIVFSSAVHGGGGSGVTVVGFSANVSFDHCEVIGNGLQGVITTPSITIHNCNFQYNGGEGIKSLAGNLVDATNNWWGDPAGPTGPAGDGVSADVDYTPYLTAPVAIGYAPPVLAKMRKSLP
jgi:hypothetical protein